MRAIIASPTMKSQVFIKDGNTSDIMNVILNVIKNYNISAETKEFSKGFKATYKDMERLYWFVKDNVEYREDPTGFQWIRTPARTWHDRNEGLDCKSFTVFMVSVFQNLGLPYIVRFASYSKSPTPTHVYPLVKIGNRWVIMDAVWDKFDSEKSFTHKKDFKMSEIAVLSGVKSPASIKNSKIGMLLRDSAVTVDFETQNLIAELTAVTDSIPDYIIESDGGDLTSMTGGEFSRWLAAKQYPEYAGTIRNGLISSSTPQSISQFIIDTAGNTAPAFPIPFDLSQFEGTTEGPYIQGVFSKIGDWFKNQWQKLVNFIFKDGLKKSAEFFMYVFAQRDKLTAILKTKQDKQNTTLSWMANASGQSLDQYKATIRSHIMTKNGGKTPETLLNEAATKRNTLARQTWVSAVLAALPVVIDIIKKIATLFKKKDVPVVSAEDGSDLGEYGAEMGIPETPNYGGDTSTLPTQSGGTKVIVPSNSPTGGGGIIPTGNGSTTSGGNNNMALWLFGGIAAFALLRK